MKRTKLLSILLSATMILSLAGCGDFSIETTSATIPSGNAKPVEEEVVEVVAGPSTTVEDFYNYANSQWFADTELPAKYAEITWRDSATDKLYDNTKALLDKTSKDSFEADTAEYKMLSFHEQLLDGAAREAQANAKIASIVNQIQGASSLSQVYNLMKDDTISLFDRVMDTKYLFTDGATYRISVLPSTLFRDNVTYTDSEKAIIVSYIGKMLAVYGMSEDKATEVATNAMTVNQKIVDFYNSIPAEQSGYIFYNHENWEEANTSLPFIEILRARGLSRYAGESGDEYGFFTMTPYFAFMNDLCVSENATLLRDYLTVAAAYDLAPYAGESILMLAISMSDDLAGVTDHGQLDLERQAYGALTNIDKGVLANLYAAEYIPADLRKEMKKFGDNAKDQIFNAFKNATWMKNNTREKMRGKVRVCTVTVGNFETYNDYADMTIGATSVDTAISLLKSNRAYEKAVKEAATAAIEPTDFDFFTTNAQFDVTSNTVFLGNGILLLDATTTEEKQATIGYVIAHEYCHAYDYANVCNIESGVYQMYFTEDQWAEMMNRYNAIATFFNNVETPYGNLNGGRVMNETYADLLAMQICIEMLSSKKDIDFEAFFKAYAKYYAAKQTPEYASLLYRADWHLPADVRVNYILAQFDKFYETFDIPEGSPYYVAPEERLQALY